MDTFAPIGVGAPPTHQEMAPSVVEMSAPSLLDNVDTEDMPLAPVTVPDPDATYGLARNKTIAFAAEPIAELTDSMRSTDTQMSLLSRSSSFNEFSSNPSPQSCCACLADSCRFGSRIDYSDSDSEEEDSDTDAKHAKANRTLSQAANDFEDAMNAATDSMSRRRKSVVKRIRAHSVRHVLTDGIKPPRAMACAQCCGKRVYCGQNCGACVLLCCDSLHSSTTSRCDSIAQAWSNVYNFFYERSLMVLTPENPLRALALRVASHTKFDLTILTIIMINSIFMAMDNPTSDDDSELAGVLRIADNVFTVLYTIEMLIKVVANGFLIGKNAYCKSGWNLIDLTVVVTGWIAFGSSSSSDFGTIRVIRLFKILRMVSMVPGMHNQVEALFLALPSLVGVFVLFTFIFLLFGLIGMQLFSGSLHSQCYDSSTSTFATDPRGYPEYCAATWLGGASCAVGTICVDDAPNPNEGLTSFDNLLVAWLTILQSISLEGWVDVMYAYGATASKYSYIYFVCLVLFGGWFMVNLVIAVLVSSFQDSKDADRILAKERRKKRHVKRFLRTAKRSKSKRNLNSMRSLRSMRSMRSMRSVNGGGDDDETNLRSNVRGVSRRQILARKQSGKVTPIQSFASQSRLKKANASLDQIDHTDDTTSTRTSVVSFAPISSQSGSPDQRKKSSLKRHSLSASLTSGSGGDGDLPNTNTRTASVTFGAPSFAGEEQQLQAAASSNPHRGNLRAMKKERESSRMIAVSSQGGAEDSTNAAAVVTDVDPSNQDAASTTSSLRLATASPDKTAKPSRPSVRFSETHDTRILPEASHQASMSEILDVKTADTSTSSTGAARTTTFAVRKFLRDLGQDDSSMYSQSNTAYGRSETTMTTMTTMTNMTNMTADTHADWSSKSNILLAARKKSLRHLQSMKHSQRLSRHIKGMMASGKRGVQLSTCRLLALTIVAHKYFEYMIYFLILGNTITLSMDHYGIDQSTSDILETFNQFFTAAFAAEMVIKVYALGPKLYARSKLNLFDGLIVLTSFMELGMAGSSGVSALRAFRLLRVLRILEAWSSLHGLLTAFIKSLKSLIGFGGILLVFIFIFAILGINLLAGKVVDPQTGDAARSNFDSLPFAFITVFQIITGEGWNEVMVAGVNGAGWWVALYFVVVYVLGNFLVLNLFLATLMESFASYADTAPLPSTASDAVNGSASGNGNGNVNVSVGATSLNGASIAQSSTTSIQPSLLPFASASKLSLRRMDTTASHGSELSSAETVANGSETWARSATNRSSYRDWQHADGVSIATSRTNMSLAGQSEFNGGDSSSSDEDVTNFHRGDSSDNDEEETEVRVAMYDRFLVRQPARRNVFSESCCESLAGRYGHCVRRYTTREHALCCLAPRNHVRMTAARWISSDLFERVIFFFILFSCGVLAVKADPDDQVFYVINLVITIIFAIEALLKIFTFGFIMHKTSYLRADPFNILDFMIVCIDITFFFTTNVSFVKVIRMLRVMRSMRLISSLKGMRVTITSLFRALPGILNVVLMLGLFLLLFGLFGVQLFKGLLYRCSDGSDADISTCVGTFTDPYESWRTLPREWTNPAQHFDHIGAAMLTLFEVSTLEMWPNIMFLVVDASPHDEAPIRDNHPEAGLFFVAYIVLVSFFVLNMFVGVVYSEFKRVKAGRENTLFLTDEQRYWIDIQRKIIFTVPPKVPVAPDRWHSCRMPFFNLATHPAFDASMNIAIVLNVIQLAVQYEGMSDSMNNWMDIISAIFTFVFVFEAFVKITGFGWKQYKSSTWNKFDFFIVIVTTARFILSNVMTSTSLNVSFLRIFRTFRIFRFAKQFRGLKRLFQTLVLSLYSLVNIGILLAILMFVFAVLGMNFFDGVRHGLYLDENANFDTFFSSLLTLYRMLSGENWNGIMHDCSVQPPLCTEGVDCGSVAAPLYFVAFIVLGNFVVLNLFITVILEQFSTMNREDKFCVSDDDVKLFARAWAAFAPEGSKLMPSALLPMLLTEIPMPLGLKEGTIFDDNPFPPTRAEIFRKLRRMRVKDRDGFVHYHEVLNELVRLALGPKTRIKQDCGPVRDLSILKDRVFPELKFGHSTAEDGKQPLYVAHVFAAIMLQSRWRARKSRRDFEEASEIAASEASFITSMHGQKQDSGTSVASSGINSVSATSAAAPSMMVPVPPAAGTMPDNSAGGRRSMGVRLPPLNIVSEDGIDAGSANENSGGGGETDTECGSVSDSAASLDPVPLAPGPGTCTQSGTSIQPHEPSAAKPITLAPQSLAARRAPLGLHIDTGVSNESNDAGDDMKSVMSVQSDIIAPVAKTSTFRERFQALLRSRTAAAATTTGKADGISSPQSAPANADSAFSFKVTQPAAAAAAAAAAANRVQSPQSAHSGRKNKHVNSDSIGSRMALMSNDDTVYYTLTPRARRRWMSQDITF
jgi:Ion transport protein